ncbi:MAG: hypothetical protein HN948_00860 [Clostridia bacterium]|jgi:hypothetical protein|nr:hypothetical protein [Clostridia bacterium]MBT7121539.1 hypothetical protein [Clostridia bacterium]
MKKTVMIILCLVLLAAAGCAPVHMSARKLPIDFYSVERIEIYAHSFDEPVSVVEGERDIEAIVSLIEYVEEESVLGTPACPFGLILKITDQNRTYTIRLSTDGCGDIKYGDEYYGSFDADEMRQTIERITGESFDRFF